jgi:hypothetical protein
MIYEVVNVDKGLKTVLGLATGPSIIASAAVLPHHNSRNYHLPFSVAQIPLHDIDTWPFLFY